MTNAAVSVLVTRPKAQAESWMQAVQQQGWQGVSFPALEIQALEITPQQKGYVLGLDQYQGIICISTNAADIGLGLLADYWPQWPVSQAWYAVGPATAEAMVRWQIKPKMPSQYDSEGLLGLASLKQVQDQQFLILKGEGGRDTLRNTLCDRGARVDELPLYRRAVPGFELSVLDQWLTSDVSKVITISSGDALKNLMVMASDRVGMLQQLPLVVVSERLKVFAAQQGFAKVINAGGTSADKIIKVIGQLN